MTAGALPTRWIACVDGTWCTPDGAYGLPSSPDTPFKGLVLTLGFKGNRHDNISNIYRICATIKVGECVDESSGTTFNQVQQGVAR